MQRKVMKRARKTQKKNISDNEDWVGGSCLIKRREEQQQKKKICNLIYEYFKKRIGKKEKKN